MGIAALPPLTAENGLARCMRYYPCSANCRRVQSLSRRYATSKPAQSHDNGIYHTSTMLHDKNTPNSNSANIYSKISNSMSYNLSA